MRSPVYLRPALAALAGLAVLLAAGCSADDPAGGSAAPSPSATTPVPTSDDPGSPAPSPPVPATTPCPATGDGVPADAVSAPAVDVDADGRPDTVWLADADSGLRLGITTASGGTATTSVDDLAGGGARSALVADYDQSGDILAFVSDGRTADLYAFSQCALIRVVDSSDVPYQFDLGFRGTGTGVGCVDADDDGSPDLVGLNLILDSAGDPLEIDRTVIELSGPTARADATDVLTELGAPEVALARGVSCGDLTLSQNGVSLPG